MKWSIRNNFFNFFFIVVILPVIIVRCTPEKKFQVLSIFFDGVPDPNKKTEVTTVATSDTAGLAVKNVEPDSYVHKPYDEDKCESCHERGFSNSLIKPQPELCYTCHEDFRTKYQTLHAPVSSGYCTACHHQHMAKNKKLLIRESQNICLFCHENKQVFKNKLHSKIGDQNCIECHSPHGGDNRGLLIDGSCYNCHEEFNSKYNFLHGPVASGNCTACHSSHAAKSPKLLLRESQQLCLFCHNIDQVFKNEAHKKAKKNNCTDCHDPHGGEDRFILTQALRPSKKQSVNKRMIEVNSDSLSKIKSLIINEIENLNTNPVNPNDNPVNSDSLKENNYPLPKKQNNR